MQSIDKFPNLELAGKLLPIVSSKAKQLADRMGRRPVIMEVCGTHTAAISRSGLRSLLRDAAELRSGPGCPVCVTGVADLDLAVALAGVKGLTITTFGDMLRVPGSFSSLEKERAKGAKVRVIYNPLQAVRLAEANPGEEFVLIGVGFETTAPLAALCIAEARKLGLRNFYLLSLHKLLAPALRVLLSEPGLPLDGLLLPGHVCAVTGRGSFDFIAKDYGIPAVVTGFETTDILQSLFYLLEMVEKGSPQVLNGYSRVVKEEGNSIARAVLEEFFTPTDAVWRGLGGIPASGLHVRREFSPYDAALKFPVSVKTAPGPSACRCSDVLRGRIIPPECPLFAAACKPANPFGPCMVSSEGACAAYYAELNAKSDWSG